MVIPAYNEGRRLPPTLDKIQRYLSGRPHEIVVVDDGSRDDTVARAAAAGVTVVSNEGNRGKGYSVRRGMLQARGDRRLMTDADLSTPIEELDRLMKKMDEGYDVVIASRALPESNVEVRQPWYRENSGRLFNFCVRLLALPGLQDTQCGFQLFRRGGGGEGLRPHASTASPSTSRPSSSRAATASASRGARHLAQRRHPRRHPEGAIAFARTSRASGGTTWRGAYDGPRPSADSAL